MTLTDEIFHSIENVVLNYSICKYSMTFFYIITKSTTRISFKKKIVDVVVDVFVILTATSHSQ